MQKMVNIQVWKFVLLVVEKIYACKKKIESILYDLWVHLLFLKLIASDSTAEGIICSPKY